MKLSDYLESEYRQALDLFSKDPSRDNLLAIRKANEKRYELDLLTSLYGNIPGSMNPDKVKKPILLLISAAISLLDKNDKEEQARINELGYLSRKVKGNEYEYKHVDDGRQIGAKIISSVFKKELKQIAAK